MEMFMFENTKKKWSSVYPMLQAEGDKEKYQAFMRAALKKFGVESPAELSKEKKKEFFDYVDKNYVGDHEKDDPNAESVKKAHKGTKPHKHPHPPVEEALEIGTDKYAKYVKTLTPGQGDKIEQNSDNKRNGLAEKAVSQQQQKLMGLAYAVKKGEMSAPSSEVQKIADSMSLEELKKMAEGKHKDLPVKKEDVKMCPDECCGVPVSECTCPPDCPHCDCNAVTEKTKSVKEVNFNKLDARRKEFKEKVKQLYYEKIRKSQGTTTTEAKKEKVETKKPNKISINPDLKEYKGYDLAKKFFKRDKPEITEEEQNILKFIKENEAGSSSVATKLDFAGTENPMSGEQSITLDAQPASVMSIAKAWKMSPMRVQEILDKMVRMGTVTRIGDAYSAGSTEVAN